MHLIVLALVHVDGTTLLGGLFVCRFCLLHFCCVAVSENDENENEIGAASDITTNN